MLKSVKFTFMGPICKCKQMDWSWAFSADKQGKTQIMVWCLTCKTQVHCPIESATIELNRGYPEGTKPKEAKTPDELPNPAISDADRAFMKDHKISGI